MSKSVPEVMQYCGVCEQNALLSDPLAWSDADMELDIELKKRKTALHCLFCAYIYTISVVLFAKRPPSPQFLYDNNCSQLPVCLLKTYPSDHRHLYPCAFSPLNCYC